MKLQKIGWCAVFFCIGSVFIATFSSNNEPANQRAAHAQHASAKP